MKRMNLNDFWKSRDKASTNTILIEIADICGKSIQTIQAWMLGYRKPNKLEATAISNYLKEKYQVEIIEEGGQ